MVGRLRTLVTVSEQYGTRHGSYANNATSLSASGLLGPGVHFTSQGYTLDYAGTSTTWQCTADPNVPGTDGNRFFHVDHSGGHPLPVQRHSEFEQPAPALSPSVPSTRFT